MDDNYVEAIEDGKIVKVTEDYARREGLLIIRKPTISVSNTPKKEDDRRLLFDDFRRPIKKPKSQVMSELKEHFYWEVAEKRKKLNLTRKQLASAIGVYETDIKMIENGTLPKDDFVIINKLQNYLGVNLRKDNKDFNSSARKSVETLNPGSNHPYKQEVKDKSGSEKENIEEDIEIFGDDIILK